MFFRPAAFLLLMLFTGRLCALECLAEIEDARWSGESTELHALFAGIRRFPDDDTRRLVTADWLTEHGNESWGAYIRFQVDPIQYPALDLVTQLRATLEAETILRISMHRSQEFIQGMNGLLRTGGGSVFGTAPPNLKAIESGGWKFDRGFPLPQIQVFTALLGEETTTRFFDGAFTRHHPAYGLELVTGEWDHDTLPVLAHSPAAKNLKSIVVRFRQADADAYASLFAGAPFPALRRLYVGGVSANAEFGRMLADSPLLSQLEELEFDTVGLNDPEISAIVMSPHARNLKRLRVISRIGNGTLEAIATSKSMQGLRDLDLGGNLITDEGIRAFCRTAHLPALRALSVRWNPLTDKSLFALAECQALSELEALDVSHTGFTAVGLRALLRSTTLRKLRSLYLHGGDERAGKLDGLKPLVSRLGLMEFGPPAYAYTDRHLKFYSTIPDLTYLPRADGVGPVQRTSIDSLNEHLEQNRDRILLGN